ncbi:MAG: hypothetical protein KF889_19065 [Alphaproteobacteria bacterium]|nr:hypothetical protein [Alphaproteobacteria bacterium]MCW5744123.1 hypothetical protein [Alphaproteobacteria bacterium]
MGAHQPRPFLIPVCKACVEKANGTTEGEPPCILAERAVHATGRTQVRFVPVQQIGNPCPAALSWKDLRRLMMDRNAVYDVDAYGRSSLPIFRSKIPKHQFGGSGPDSDWACSEFLVPDGRNYRTVMGEPRVPIAVYAHDSWWSLWRRETYYKQVTMDPFTTWLGLAGKGGIGGGVGQSSRGGEATGGIAFNVGQSSLSKATDKRSVVFSADILRTKTIGADVGAGWTIVLIFGLDKPERLNGVKFGGEDVNIAIGAAVGKLAKAPEYWRLIKLVNAIRAGERVAADKIDKAWTAIKGLYWGSNAYMSRGSDVIVTLIDTPVSVGVGISYVMYEGVITSAGPGPV